MESCFLAQTFPGAYSNLGCHCFWRFSIRHYIVVCTLFAFGDPETSPDKVWGASRLPSNHNAQQGVVSFNFSPNLSKVPYRSESIIDQGNRYPTYAAAATASLLKCWDASSCIHQAGAAEKDLTLPAAGVEIPKYTSWQAATTKTHHFTTMYCATATEVDL